ncbi:nitrite reductase large subunit NirB [Fictibacillus phosphorivorans]|uniref:nitrite reductase large subunit NirB n=1 Tax=Fictibacillus phosphorivorans TaxID=1221500 RepID=UPI0020423D8A|nr:nitrite reductase large subunit NirB [Fictibacillus phosphorivorans]MCM3718807.1 nitrite reductase large subunit NirB [Fictibacillus phosphorivorans]MCM3776430.1 nitrite reductase large subunit NirB [Fictibacillus phosphorivorans]
MKKKKLVLVGNGMAGVRCIEEILKIDSDGFEITIFGREPYPNYNRILLSTVLQGDTSIDDITINELEWYEQHNIQLYTGETVVEIDKERKQVYTDKDRQIEYDELILATGSLPFMLPLPGADKEGVTAFRDIQDCQTMIESAQQYRKAVVIGGGLLGLEAARGLLNLGMEVDVVHICEHLMERQLDPTASKMLQKELEAQGMNFLLNKQTEEIFGSRRVEGLLFKDGSKIEADLVVMAVGIRPNVQLAKNNGIQVNRGIVVNDYMQTDCPNIYAVGECAEHREIVYGLVAPLYEQGKILAEKVCGVESKKYEGSVVSTQLKVSGVDVFSAGDFLDNHDTNSIKVYDDFEGIYKKVVFRDDKVAGAVLFGDIGEGPKLLNMINDRTDISNLSKVAILQDHSGGESSKSAALEMVNSEVICGCNGVTKGEICGAIVENGLTTVDQVKDNTNASRSCGGCKPLVQDLLEYTLGDEFDQSEIKEAVCGCTTLSREEVIEEIKSKNLKFVKEIMNVLGWKNEEGCSKCRPALNYYLGMLYPSDYEDEQESRFVNDRLHANIQKDGTYSVVPRMYGGVTNVTDLRKIADVAEKYDVPMIKLTGGQRIDLLGIKKEDLPKVWADLDMPSGYAYGKALRTVKTCVGSQFCRFGTQDSTQLGIDLEKKFERLNTPHKVKMSVSACPRNCAESGIKDVGIVGVDGGFEIYVGGNGGTHLRAGDLLCTVKKEKEVIETTAAFLQYYRETATYLERTSKWIERIGLENIREVLFDEENKKQLVARIEEALAHTKDPWEEIVKNQEIQEKLFRNLETQTSVRA